jgi:hypothetical protein
VDLGKAWLRLSRDCKQRGTIVAGDQGSRRGHQFSETSLTGEPGFVLRGGIPGT